MRFSRVSNVRIRVRISVIIVVRLVLVIGWRRTSGYGVSGIGCRGPEVYPQPFELWVLINKYG